MKRTILLIIMTGFVLAQSNWTAQTNKPPVIMKHLEKLEKL